MVLADGPHAVATVAAPLVNVPLLLESDALAAVRPGDAVAGVPK